MTLDGTYEKRADGFHVIRFERFIDRPVQKIWAAISDPKVLKNWLGDVEVEPRVGGKFIIQFRDPKAVMTGRITAFEPQRLLEATWREKPAESESVMRWELAAASAGCRLVLTHTFPPEKPQLDILPFFAGWHQFLDVLPVASDGVFVPYGYEDERKLDAAYRNKFAALSVPEDRGFSSRVPSIRFERVLPGPIERVWDHLTDPKRLPAWFGDNSTIEPEMGGRVSLMGGHIRGVVTQWSPPNRLTYTWNVFGPDDGPDAVSAYPESYLSLVLEPMEKDVRLTLVHFPVLERFEKQNAMGWHTMLDMLSAALSGETVKSRAEYMKKNAALYGIDLANLAR